MAKIFGVPKEIKIPKLKFSNFNLKDYNDSLNNFVTELQNHIKKMGYVEVHSGETIRFPIADGHAEYMVLSTKPVMLIHLPIGDAWEFEYANRLTKSDIVKKIKQQKAISKFFNKKQ